MKLAWNIEQSQIQFNGIDIMILPPGLAPENVAAIVEEQDTAMVLGKPSQIIVADKKPGWYLANKLESQQTFQPGSVIIRKGKTTHLCAIIHDLDQEPTWKPEWVKQAIENIFKITICNGIKTLRLPILGAQHGHMQPDVFLAYLVNALQGYHGPLTKIWLIVPLQDYPVAMSRIKELSDS